MTATRKPYVYKYGSATDALQDGGAGSWNFIN